MTSDKPRTAHAKPLYATPADHTRASDGAQIAVIAETLGTPLIPWQRHVADVATERREDGSYEYEVVVVSVPRQTGKTTLLRAVGTHRSLVLGRDVFYTAQTGKDARARWMDLVKILRVHPALASRHKLSLRGGSEQIEWPNGSSFRVFAPTVESLHGYTPPTVMIDEAMAYTGMAGELLMGAISPAQQTIRDKQIWIVSTAGTAESTFLHDWIDRGMEGTPRVACFVYGATPEQDAFNLTDIASFHPGVGHVLNDNVLTAADVLAEASKNSRAEYERAFANRRTFTASHLIPAETWRQLGPQVGDPSWKPPTKRECVLAYDVAGDRQSAAIYAGWTTPEGRTRMRVVQAGPGVDWLEHAVNSLRREWKPRDVVAADNGPVLDVTRRLRNVRVLTEREYAIACGWVLTAIDDRTLEHDGSPDLATSFAGLVTRPAVSDGVAFSRRHSVGDSSHAVAATLAAWWATRRPATGKPEISFGGAA